jgi:hypothetical protein
MQHLGAAMPSHDFTCDCGEGRFTTATDNRSYLARYLPDQEYDTFSTLVDDAIENSGSTATEKDRACMSWRSFPMLSIWQCYACGAIYIEAPDRTRHKFLPQSDQVSKHLFKRS